MPELVKAVQAHRCMIVDGIFFVSRLFLLAIFGVFVEIFVAAIGFETALTTVAAVELRTAIAVVAIVAILPAWAVVGAVAVALEAAWAAAISGATVALFAVPIAVAKGAFVVSSRKAIVAPKVWAVAKICLFASCAFAVGVGATDAWSAPIFVFHSCKI